MAEIGTSDPVDHLIPSDNDFSGIGFCDIDESSSVESDRDARSKSFNFLVPKFLAVEQQQLSQFSNQNEVLFAQGYDSDRGPLFFLPRSFDKHLYK